MGTGRGEDGDAGTTNVQAGSTAEVVVQARDIHGDVHVGTRGRAVRWAVGGMAVAVAVLATALVVSRWGEPSGSRPPGAAAGPLDLRVTADLSSNDEQPWAFVSDSTDFPDPGLLAELSRRDGVLDPALVERVRTTPGAFPSGRQVIRLHLEGPVDRDVRVTGIRPVVRAERDVPRGTRVSASGQSGEPSVQVFLDLDEPFPVLREAVEQPDSSFEPGGPYFPGHTVSLVDGGTDEVVVTVRAREHAYEYHLLVSYQDGDRVKEVAVDDGGRPFRISGRVCVVGGVRSYEVQYGMGTDYALRTVAPITSPNLPTDEDCVP
ncbi:MAG: hypothetical protein HOV94_12960 [Saccharothrix sp.]|nr:hypothetical protein [Saccharothrix sp.]